MESTDDRSYRRTAGTLALVVLLSVSVLPLLSTGGVAQATFTAQDVTLTGNTGALTSLTVAPNGTVTYDGLEQEPDRVELVVQVKTGGTWETVNTTNVSASGLQGSVSYDFSDIDLLAQSSLTTGDFMANDGATTDTTVELRMKATLVGAGSNGTDVTTTASDTFTVTVENQAATGSVSGQANTNGGAK